MSFRNKEVPIISPEDVKAPPAPIVPPPPRVVFAEGLCDLCKKAMHEHDKIDCRGNPFVLLDVPDAELKALRERALAS